MPYRPRELVIRAREAATMLLATLDRNEMVARFLDMYAAENRRPGRADQPSFYREQLQMIRRESILAAVLRIEAALPARLKVSVTVRGAKRPARKKKKGRKAARSKPTQRTAGMDMAIPFLDLFREEFEALRVELGLLFGEFGRDQKRPKGGDAHKRELRSLSSSFFFHDNSSEWQVYFLGCSSVVRGLPYQSQRNSASVERRCPTCKLIQSQPHFER